MSDSYKARRKADIETAYNVQVEAGLHGATRFTSLGLGLAILGHYTWPWFRCVKDVSEPDTLPNLMLLKATNVGVQRISSVRL